MAAMGWLGCGLMQVGAPPMALRLVDAFAPRRLPVAVKHKLEQALRNGPRPTGHGQRWRLKFFLACIVRKTEQGL